MTQILTFSGKYKEQETLSVQVKEEGQSGQDKECELPGERVDSRFKHLICIPQNH